MPSYGPGGEEALSQEGHKAMQCGHRVFGCGGRAWGTLKFLIRVTRQVTVQVNEYPYEEQGLVCLVLFVFMAKEEENPKI